MANQGQPYHFGESSGSPPLGLSFSFSKAPSYKAVVPPHHSTHEQRLSLAPEDASDVPLFILPGSTHDIDAHPDARRVAGDTTTRRAEVCHSNEGALVPPSATQNDPSSMSRSMPLNDKLAKFAPARTTRGDTCTRPMGSFSNPVARRAIDQPSRRLSRTALGSSGLQERLLLRKQQSMCSASWSNASSFSTASSKPLFAVPLAVGSSPSENILQGSYSLRPPPHTFRQSAKTKQHKNSSPPPAPSTSATTTCSRMPEDNSSLNIIDPSNAYAPPSPAQLKSDERLSQAALISRVNSKDDQSSTMTRDRSVSHVPTEPRTGGSKTSLMMNIAEEMEHEVSRLKADVSNLTSQNESLQSENSELSFKFQTLKAKSVKAIHQATYRVDAFKVELDALKEQSKSAQTALRDCQAAKSGVSDLRSLVDESIRKIDPLINDSAEILSKASTSRDMINSIRRDTQALSTETINKQHVIDLLREQLQGCFGTLAEAQDRIVQLESEQSHTRETLSRSLMEFASAGARVTDVSEELRQQQQKTADALLQAERERGVCNSAQATLEQVRGTLSQQEQLIEKLQINLESESNAKDALRKECEIIPAMQHRLEVLSSVEQSLSAKVAQIHRLELQVSNLTHHETQSKQKDSVIEQLRSENQSLHISAGSLAVQNETLEALNTERLGELETALASVRSRLESETLTRAAAVTSAESAEKKLSTVERDLKDQVIALEGKLQRSNTRCEILDERRRDQEATIEESTSKVAKLNTDWTSSVARSASLEGGLNEARLGLARRESDLVNQQKKLDAQAKTLSTLEVMLGQLKAELVEKTNYADILEAKLTQADSLSAEQKQLTHQMQIAVQANRKLVEGLQAKLNATEARIRDLSMEAKIPRNEEELYALKAENINLEDRLKVEVGENKAREAAMKTLVARFQANEALTDQESVLVREIIQLSRTLYEKELVTKGNEIRRRDNQILELASRTTRLEAYITALGDQPATGNEPSCGTSEAGLNLFNSPLPSDLPEPVVDSLTHAQSGLSPIPTPAKSTSLQVQPPTAMSQVNITVTTTTRPARRTFADLGTTSPTSPAINHFGEDGSDDYIPPATSRPQQVEGSRTVATRRHAKRTYTDMGDDEIEDVNEKDENMESKAGRQKKAARVQAEQTAKVSGTARTKTRARKTR
ncbi:hypothetical protein FRB95_010073 [Tulasnella sp. JGI-2019a]|nr:hypothetical protein FRB95_010073 [Tulasnella sp. JGI-2019a]